MVASSSVEAVTNARRYTTCARGMCLKYVRTWLEIPSRWPDAIGAWNNANRKHPGDLSPPPGAPVFWRGGNHGHIGLSVGRGRFRGTDMTRGGLVSEQPLSWCASHWGYRYLGWTEDLNEIAIPWLRPRPPSPPLEDFMGYIDNRTEFFAEMDAYFLTRTDPRGGSATAVHPLARNLRVLPWHQILGQGPQNMHAVMGAMLVLARKFDEGGELEEQLDKILAESMEDQPEPPPGG